MPDQSNPDSAAFIVANTQGLGAGGKLSPLEEGPLSMAVREGISQRAQGSSHQLQSQVQCKLYTPEGFKISFSEQADLAVVGSLMQVRRILESGKLSGGGFPDIICDTPERVKINTRFRDIKSQNLQQVWLTLSVDESASICVHKAGQSCDIEFRPNNADGIVNFGVSFETTEPCPIAMPIEDIFRTDFLASVQDDPIAQQELLSFSLLTPETQNDVPELNGARAGAPRFLSPFGRDGIIGALSFLPVMQPKAAITVGLLPHLARVLAEAKDGIPAGTACHEVVKDIVDGREVLLPNYIMVDTAPLLTMLIGEVLKNPACKTELLNYLDQPITLNQSNGNSESGNTYRNQLEALLCHIVEIAKPFALSPDNPLLLPSFNEGYTVGDWADSKHGNFDTRITLANAALFNNALSVISEILKPVNHDCVAPALKDALAETLGCEAGQVKAQLDLVAQRFRAYYLDAFTVALPVREVKEMVKHSCTAMNISAEPALTALVGERSVEIMAIGITGDGQPRSIPNLNMAFALLDNHLPQGKLENIITLAQRPFPLGLHMEGAGLTVAAALEPQGDVLDTTKDDYHINTIWPFMSYLFVNGLMQQYQRPEIAPNLRGKIRDCVLQMSQTIQENQAFYNMELFGVDADASQKRFKPRPFEGTLDGRGRRIGCPIQLWSTLYTVAMQAVERFILAEKNPKTFL